MRSFLSALAFMLLPLCAAEATEDAKAMPRVGILAGGTPPGSSGVPRSNWSPSYAFIERLADLGWKEGQNLIIERRYAEGKLDRLPALAQDLVAKKVDVIVAFGAPTIRPAMEATHSIPIVMMGGSADPVADGLVASVTHPGGNVTGVTWAPTAEVFGKTLAILQELIPGISRVAILADGGAPPSVIRAREEISQKLQIKLERVEVRDPREIEPAVTAISKARFQAMYVTMGAGTYSYRKQIAALALAHKLPAIAGGRELPEAGGLLGYGPNPGAQVKRGAVYVDKILKGARAGDLPIENPTEFELVLNLKTAKALGISVPQSLLLQATLVIR